MAPSGLKKALSFKAVRLASLERVQQRPYPECRFGEQREMFEVTKISCKDRILKRTGDPLEGSEVVEQLEEVERALVDSVDESISQKMEESSEAVLPERTVKQDSVEVDKTTPQGRILQTCDLFRSDLGHAK